MYIWDAHLVDSRFWEAHSRIHGAINFHKSWTTSFQTAPKHQLCKQHVKVGSVLFLVDRPTFSPNISIVALVALCSSSDTLGIHFGIVLPIASFGKQINKLSLMSLSHPVEDKGTWKKPWVSLSYRKLWSPDLYRLPHCQTASGPQEASLRNKTGKKAGLNICHAVRETESAQVHSLWNQEEQIREQHQIPVFEKKKSWHEDSKNEEVKKMVLFIYLFIYLVLPEIKKKKKFIQTSWTLPHRAVGKFASCFIFNKF